MYKVLLVDDEYMITEGLKKLIPFEKWDMEVVYTAEDADQALAYVSDYPVDVVITDVNMPGKTGLEMIDQMQSILPHAAYIIMSGYQDFAYVKKALNLRVADYLLKPVNKVELGNILEKLSQTLKNPDQATANRLLHEDWSEEEFEQAIRGRKQLWIGVDKERKGFASSSYQVLGQNLQLYLSDEDEGAFLQRRFQAPYKEHFQQFKELVERSLFYGDLPLEEEDGVFNYYEPIYRVIIQGNIQQILEELNWLEETVKSHTPKVAIAKQLFIQFIMDVFHLFEHLHGDDLTEVVKAVHETTTFEDLVTCVRNQLENFFSQYRMNNNVATVLEVIGRDYRKELSLKDISKDLYINPVYLGQLIKRETNSTFAELLNKQRIKAAQQLLLSTAESIEDICYEVGYSNVGYFYKVFRKLCGKSPKAYRQQIGVEESD